MLNDDTPNDLIRYLGITKKQALLQSEWVILNQSR